MQGVVLQATKLGKSLYIFSADVETRRASVGKTFGERDDKCPMRAKLSPFGA